MLKRKLSIKKRLGIVLVFIALPLYLCLSLSSMGAVPLAAEKIWGLEHYQGQCRQFRIVRNDSRYPAPDMAYFDFDSGLTVRCIEGHWKDCGLTEEQLSAAEGTVCKVTYSKAETFGGAHWLFGISSNGRELVSEETMVNEFQKFAGFACFLFLIIVLIGAVIFLLTGQRKQTKEASERRRRRQKRSYDRRKAYRKKEKPFL